MRALHGILNGRCRLIVEIPTLSIFSRISLMPKCSMRDSAPVTPSHVGSAAHDGSKGLRMQSWMHPRWFHSARNRSRSSLYAR